MTTGKQIRAARMLLEWDAVHLADKSGLTRETIFNIERGIFRPRPATLEKIVRAFNDNGVEFKGERGVELRDDTVRVIEGNDAYLRLLDDVFSTLKSGETAFFAFVCNRLSPQEVIDKQILLRKNGIKFRCLIEAEDTFCLYPLAEYRWIPKARFHNNTLVIYGDKVGAIVTDRRKAAIIIRNRIFANTQRSLFEMLWETGDVPLKTTAPRTFYD